MLIMFDDKLCREVLRNKITLIEKDHPRKYLKEMGFIMAEKFNVKHAMTVGIFNDPASFDTMSYDMMYKLMISLKELATRYSVDIDSSDLNVDKYFTDNEKPLYEKPLEYKEEDFDIVIKDWHRQQEGQYDEIMIYTNIDEVIKWRDYNKLRFNPETQRDLIVIQTKGVPVMRLDINQKSIKQIKAKMIEGTYFPVLGHININPDYIDREPIYFSNGQLIIPKESKMDLIEGFHNYIAETQVKDENPDWKYPIKFQLLLLNKERANDFIGQMDIKNHFKPAQKARLDTDSQENYLVNRLNTSSKFHLHGTINQNYFLYLYKTISKVFSLENRKQSVELCDLLQNNINYIVEQTDHYDKPLNKKEWFLVLYLTKITSNKGLDFITVFDKIGFNSLISELDIVNLPLNKHFKIIDNAVSEVA
jgi:hypothetical protein